MDQLVDQQAGQKSRQKVEKQNADERDGGQNIGRYVVSRGVWRRVPVVHGFNLRRRIQ
jgi:hypothetical protein